MARALARLVLPLAASVLPAAAAAGRSLRGNSSARAPGRALSDSRVSCDDTQHWDNINSCGGGSDWSCTPWSFRVDWTDSCEAGSGCYTTIQCDGGDGDLIVGDDSNAATYIAKWDTGGGAWCDSRCGSDPSYFVFHTCDGAGLQSDCMGSQWYVEQLSGWNWGQNSGNPQPGEVHPTGSTQISFNFEHPGTGKDYSWYYCGWWSKTAFWSGWDPAAGWLQAAGLDPADPTPSWARDAFGGSDADATMALYPWICTVDNTPSKTGIQPGAAMHAGQGGDNWNCFCDNNGPSGSPADSAPPPHFKMYSMKKQVDGDGHSFIRVIGVAGDAIDPGVSNEDFAIYPFSDPW